MKKLQFLILTSILSIAISCGQQRRYVSYKMQKGESISDIAKRMNLNIEDLFRLNPNISSKPIEDTVIVIPNPKLKKNKPLKTPAPQDYAVINQPKQQVDKPLNDKEQKTTQYPLTVTENYKTHQVKPGETVYRITKQYEITKDQLIELNPEFPEIKNNLLSIGQVLKVKAVKNNIDTSKEEVLKQYLTHQVRAKETVYSLTRFYNISKDQLMKLNPEFPSIANNDLKVGQFLKIKPIDDIDKSENLMLYQDSIQQNTNINLALLLPFRAQEYDTVNASNIFKNNKLVNMVTDFYMGIEMAIDSISKQGVNVKVAVFDTGNRGENISEIIKNDELKNLDIIIGPFYSEKVNKVVNNTQATVVFPHYSNKQEKLSSPKIVKVAPQKSLYTKYLASYLKKEYRDETIFVVGNADKNSESTVKNMVSYLKEHDSITDIHILKPENGYIKKERFTDKMQTNKHNWLIVTAEDLVVIEDALNSSIGLPEDTTVQVFATNKGEAYNRIDNNKLAFVNFTYVSDTFTDENSQSIKEFNKKFKEKNMSLPSSYAIKGFDIAYDILIRYASGNKLAKTFKQGVSLRIENKFNYHKNKFGAANNQGLFIVKYNADLSLSRVK
ncbi:MAG: LysM peptidoglycan-binding domain-containing protein [Tenacibaculum sp.]